MTHNFYIPLIVVFLQSKLKSMLDKLEAIKERYEYVSEQLGDPDVVSDMKRYTKISKEYKNLGEIVTAYDAYKNVLDNIATNKEILATEEDEEFREMAKMELDELLPKVAEMEEEIKFLLIPKDPEDEKNAVMEIRAGTGGDEASIFAGDLYRMYTRFFDNKKWTHETIATTEGSSGGYSKIAIQINGNNVYGTLKFESGGHRVQRVPRTESQGRVHTSAATVVVMPRLEMEDVNVNKADLKWDTFRASGAGGQHVNKTESAVRVTHLPTGVVVECQDGRSQIRNREIAEERLYAKLYDKQREEHESKVAGARKSLVGTGDRSGKVRTYNYPQNRVTDHRINLTLYNLSAIIDGDVAGIIEALQVADNAEKLKAGLEN